MLTSMRSGKRRHFAQSIDDDSGNVMIIAMAVLMIMGILAAAVWSSTISGMKFAARDQQHTTALEVANAGLDEAMFRIEQYPPSQFNSGESFVGSGSIQGQPFKYRATKGNALTWTVTATGSAQSDITRSISASVVTQGLYPYAIYAGKSLTMNGNTGNDIYSYDSAVSLGAVVDTGRPGNASFGSSGSFNCNGNSGGATNHQYPPGGDVNCPNMIDEPDPYVHADPAVPTGAIAPPAPGGCTLTAANAPSLQPSTNYVCTNLVVGTNASSAICTAAAADQDHPIKIYVTGTLTFGDDVHVNVGNAANGGCENGTNDKPTRMPGGFRVLVTGNCGGGSINVGSGSSNPVMAMVLDAPKCDLVYNGGPHVYFYGAMTVGSYRSNGNIGTIAYDDNLARLTTQQYVARNWHEVVPVNNP